MGANCCISAKERPQPSIAPVDVSAYRVRHSPSWSFRWDHRTHIEDIMENNTVFSNQSSGNIQPEVKINSIAPTEGHTSGDSLPDACRRVKWQKSDKKMEASKLSKVDPRDQSTANNPLPEADSCKSTDIVTAASDIKTSQSPLPSPILKADSENPTFSMSSIHTDLNSTSKARQSPGHQLYSNSKITDENFPAHNPFTESSSEERRPSNSMLSACSNDLFAGRSQGEPSGVCSSPKPSGLVPTYERDRWSVDSELFGSIANKTARSSASHTTALSRDQEICKLCSRLLKERSSWNGHELAVVAVLFCGHSYHGNCLDSITAESEKFDPPCPVCTHGETCTAKLFGKMEFKVGNKTSKNMADSDLDRSSNNQKKFKREPRLGTSSSMKDTFSRPFLRRHFSTGSRSPAPVSGSEPPRKRSFWLRHWRE